MINKKTIIALMLTGCMLLGAASPIKGIAADTVTITDDGDTQTVDDSQVPETDETSGNEENAGNENGTSEEEGNGTGTEEEEPEEPDEPEEPEVLEFEAEADITSVYISFTDDDNALSYNIYRKDGKKYKRIKKLPAGSMDFEDTGLSELQKYSYKVSAIYSVPVESDGEEEESEPKTEKKEIYFNNGKALTVITGLKEVKLKSAEAVKISAKVKWKKSNRADGYILYRKLSGDKSFTKVKKIKDQATTSYLDKKVNLDKTYIYKVVAYAALSGKTYKSEDSNTVKCKVALKLKSKRVTDKNSSVYGKKIGTLTYADGSTISDIEKYLSDDDKDYVIYVNKAKGQTTVYATRGSTLIPVRSFICSPGAATPIGTHHTIVKLRWHELMGPCWGQWCTKVVSNGIYFHSIFYNSYNNNKNLSVTAYNRLGTVCSHGCIRLQAYAAKWIYDNCNIGTKVIVCSKSGYEPMKRPSLSTLPYWHTWDPTDPGAVKYCKEHHCHGQ